MNVETSDRWNSQLTSELPTLSIFENNGNWVKVCEVSELSTHAGTSNRWNSRPSRHLKTSRWPLAVHTRHVRYDHHSELSKSVKLETSKLPTIVGTPDCRNSRLTDPRTSRILSWLGTCRTRPVSIRQTSKNKLAILSLKHSKTHMGWHEHLWMIIYQHDASLLIVRHTY